MCLSRRKLETTGPAEGRETLEGHNTQSRPWRHGQFCGHVPEAVVVGVGDAPEDALHGLRPAGVGHSRGFRDGDHFVVGAAAAVGTQDWGGGSQTDSSEWVEVPTDWHKEQAQSV